MTRERIVIHSSPPGLWGLLGFAFRGLCASSGQARLSHALSALLEEQVAPVSHAWVLAGAGLSAAGSRRGRKAAGGSRVQG